MTASTMRKLKKLDRQRASLVNAMGRQLLRSIEEYLDELKDLGLQYRLVKSGSGLTIEKKRHRRGPGKKPCPICHFQTAPAHDARRHRFAQGGQKKPFTPAELQKLKLRRV